MNRILVAVEDTGRSVRLTWKVSYMSNRAVHTSEGKTYYHPFQDTRTETDEWPYGDDMVERERMLRTYRVDSLGS